MCRPIWLGPCSSSASSSFPVAATTTRHRQSHRPPPPGRGRGPHGRPRRRVAPRRGRGLLPRHGRRPDPDAFPGRRAQQLDRVDRRQRPPVGRARGQERGVLRPAEDGLLLPLPSRSPAVRPLQPLDGARPGQRALLREGQGAGPGPLRPVARQARRGPIARPIRSRTRRSIRASRSARGARQDLPVGLLLRLRDRHRRPAPVPNPAFDEKAGEAGMRRRYYTDPSYYKSKDLVRPYRVGMSCGFCHVGPEPVQPTRRSGEPEVGESGSNVGAQYFWIDRIFTWEADESSFAYQLFHTSRPGALDTSLVSTDYINNPRTMNAIYNLGARLAQGKRWGDETLAGGERDNKQFNDYVRTGSLSDLFQKPDTVLHAARAQGRLRLRRRSGSAQPRLRQHRPVQRGVAAALQSARRRQADLADRDQVGRANSSYWQANEAQTPDLAAFFLATTAPHLLRNAPGGAAYLPKDAGEARLAARRSSPSAARAATRASCPTRRWPGSIPAAARARLPRLLEQVLGVDQDRRVQEADAGDRPEDDFLKDNFLSTELAFP